MNGTASDATKNCIKIDVPAPATARLPIIKSAIDIAAANGNKATQPNSATLGRMMRRTPPNAMNVAVHLVAFVRSCRKMALKTAVIIGLVKPIAVASAKGMTKIDKKKQMVAMATANPRRI